MGCRQQGQALIEALIGGAILLMLLLAVVVIGKIHAVDLASAQAARQLVFNCGYQPDACTNNGAEAPGADHWRQRFTGASPNDYFHKPLWVGRQGQPMLESANDIALHISQEPFGAMPGAAARGPRPGGSDPVDFLSDQAGPDKFGLSISAGLLTSHAKLKLFSSQGDSRPEDIFTGMALQPNAQVSLLTDAWNASGPYGGQWSVHARVDKGWRVQASADQLIRAGYASTKILIKGMKLLFLEDQADEFKHGEIPMDLVPADRLPAYAGGEQ